MDINVCMKQNKNSKIKNRNEIINNYGLESCNG